MKRRIERHFERFLIEYIFLFAFGILLSVGWLATSSADERNKEEFERKKDCVVRGGIWVEYNDLSECVFRR